MATPVTRLGRFLQSTSVGDVLTPITRIERFLYAIATGGEVPEPITHLEHFLVSPVGELREPVTRTERIIYAVRTGVEIPTLIMGEEYLLVQMLTTNSGEPVLPHWSEWFARVSNYPVDSLPIQLDVDNFITSKINTGSTIFYLININNGSNWYILSSSGTQVTFNQTTGYITSNGNMFTCEISNFNRPRGISIDFSSFKPITILENYTHQ